MCATVTHLILEPKILEDFNNDKIKSTYSISVANKQIPLFGKAWGILSKKQIHINSLHADWYPMIEYKDKEEVPVEVTIGIIGMAIMVSVFGIMSFLTSSIGTGEVNPDSSGDVSGLFSK